MLYLRYILFVLVLATGLHARGGTLPDFRCNDSTDPCLNTCITDYINVILEKAQRGELSWLVILDPYVYPQVDIFHSPAHFTLTNISYFPSQMRVVKTNFKSLNDLEITFHMNLLIHDSNFAVETVIDDQPIQASGRAVLALKNYRFIYRTQVIQKKVAGVKVLQLKNGEAKLSADDILFGLNDIISLNYKLPYQKELELRHQFSAVGYNYLNEIKNIPAQFVDICGNAVLRELKLTF